jgi:D-beta-D-heptose 7-phosphate kinase/D-beta-D-heptose 1-phosphate adenosyltransferase
MTTSKSKIISLSKLIAWRNKQKKAGKKIIFTNGCFDILHSGHITLLEKSRNFGDYLVVGLNSDNSVRRIKGKKRPINNQLDRAIVLAGLQSVDFVVIFNEDTPHKLLSLLKPDILVKGADYKTDQIIGKEFVSAVKTIALVKGKSTTAVIKKLKR